MSHQPPEAVLDSEDRVSSCSHNVQNSAARPLTSTVGCDLVASSSESSHEPVLLLPCAPEDGRAVVQQQAVSLRQSAAAQQGTSHPSPVKMLQHAAGQTSLCSPPSELHNAYAISAARQQGSSRPDLRQLTEAPDYESRAADAALPDASAVSDHTEVLVLDAPDAAAAPAQDRPEARTLEQASLRPWLHVRHVVSMRVCWHSPIMPTHHEYTEACVLLKMSSACLPFQHTALNLAITSTFLHKTDKT